MMPQPSMGRGWKDELPEPTKDLIRRTLCATFPKGEGLGTTGRSNFNL